MNTFIIHLRTFLITREFTVLSIFICFAFILFLLFLFHVYIMFCALVPVEGNNTLIALISLCFIHTLLKYQNTNTKPEIKMKNENLFNLFEEQRSAIERVRERQKESESEGNNVGKIKQC